jgi:hypothetical protein
MALLAMLLMAGLQALQSLLMRVQYLHNTKIQLQLQCCTFCVLRAH